MMQGPARTFVNSKSRAQELIIFFIIYPFGAFLYSLKNFGSRNANFVLLGFFTLYGLTFIPIENSDSEKYVQFFNAYQHYSFDEYLDQLKSVFAGTAINPDFYAPTLLYLTSRVSDNAQFFFCITAFIYFSCFLKLIYSIKSSTCTNNFTIFSTYLIGCIFILNLSAGINNIRYPLAFVHFSWAVLGYLTTNQKRYILYSFFAPLIHFAMWLPCGFFVLFHFMCKSGSLIIFYAVAILAVFTDTFFSDIIEQNIASFGQGVENKFSGYTREGYVVLREAHRAKWNWYVSFNMYATYYYLLAAIALTRLSYFKLRIDRIADKIFAFVLLAYAQSSLTGNILDSISNRYVFILKLFGLIYLLYISSMNASRPIVQVLVYAYMPILALTVLVAFRADWPTFSPFLFIGNFITMFFSKSFY